MFKSPQEWQENYVLQGQLCVLPFFQKVVYGHSVMTVLLTVNVTLKKFTVLPILMHNCFGGDMVALGIISPPPASGILISVRTSPETTLH